jgi:hypothetical protein
VAAENVFRPILRLEGFALFEIFEELNTGG